MKLRVALFLGWLACVALAPAVALLPRAPAWVSYLPWLSAVVAVISVAFVVRPRSWSPLTWLLDVAAVAAAALPPRRPTSQSTQPPSEPRP
jgi:hypothetical protein